MRCHGIAWRLGPAAEHRGIYRAARACGGKTRPERIDTGSAKPSGAIDVIPSVDCTDHLRPMSQPLLTDKATTAGTKLDQAALKLAALDLEVATQSLFLAGQQRQYAEPCRDLLEFIAEGPAVAALQGALLPSSKLEAATIENYQVNIALDRPHAGRQQQGRQGGDRTDCARATPKPQHRITWTRSRATPNPGAWSPNNGRSRFCAILALPRARLDGTSRSADGRPDRSAPQVARKRCCGSVRYTSRSMRHLVDSDSTR